MRAGRVRLQAEFPHGWSDSQIVFMQELALIPFLAQSPQPVFANQIVEGMCDAVLVRTGVPQRTMPFSEGLAEGPVRIQAEAILPLEKVGESEVIGRWRLRFHQDFPGETGRTDSWGRGWGWGCCAAIDSDGHS